MNHSLISLVLLVSLNWTGNTAFAQQCLTLFSIHTPPTSPRRADVRNLPRNFDFSLFPQGTVARDYINLALQGYLIRQTDPTLRDLGLLVPNGGLCATTCATNLLGAFLTPIIETNVFHQVSPNLVHELVRDHRVYILRDARFGAHVSDVSELIISGFHDFLNTLSFNSSDFYPQLLVKHTQPPYRPVPVAAALRYSNSIAIATVMPVQQKTEYQDTSHAIVLLKVDIKNKLIYFSDPNDPNRIVRQSFEGTLGTNLIFRVPLTYQGDFVRIVDLTVFTRTWKELL